MDLKNRPLLWCDISSDIIDAHKSSSKEQHDPWTDAFLNDWVSRQGLV